jgi:hypothetical protein
MMQRVLRQFKAIIPPSILEGAQRFSGAKIPSPNRGLYPGSRLSLDRSLHTLLSHKILFSHRVVTYREILAFKLSRKSVERKSEGSHL